MSRYDLEEALREFITSTMSGHEDDHDEHFASYDHEHDNAFEDKVDYYLGNFNVGSGCNTQRNFEQAVKACFDSFLNEHLGTTDPVRAMLRGLLAEARALHQTGEHDAEIITLLGSCLSQMRNLARTNGNGVVSTSTY